MNKKTLYITDLDGTLLNSSGKLSDYSRQTIELLTSKGVLFSIATARNLPAAKNLIGELPLSAPGILNNGVAFYDFNQQNYMKINGFPTQDLPIVIDIFKEYSNYGFLYALKDDEIHFIYKKYAWTKDADIYFNERYNRYFPRCHEIEDFMKLPADFVPLYFILNEKRDYMEPIIQKISSLANINCILSQNLYADNYFLDILHKDASKGIAIKQLKEMTGADEVVVFGDNYNDLEMLKAADRSYVPSNGIPQAKELATQVIDSNDQDAVVNFIKQDMGL